MTTATDIRTSHGYLRIDRDGQWLYCCDSDDHWTVLTGDSDQRDILEDCNEARASQKAQ